MNSPNTVKFNFPRSDIVWCGKPNANTVKQQSLLFFVYSKSYPVPRLIQFRLKVNKPKSVSQRVS